VIFAHKSPRLILALLLAGSTLAGTVQAASEIAAQVSARDSLEAARQAFHQVPPSVLLPRSSRALLPKTNDTQTPLPKLDQAQQQAVQQIIKAAAQRAAQRQAQKGGAQSGQTPSPSLADILQLDNDRHVNLALEKLFPHTVVPRGGHAVSELPRALRNMEAVRISTGDSGSISVKDWMNDTATDGLLVLHRGQIVYEFRDRAMGEQQPHALWSVGKSLAGLVAADLVQEGTLDASAPISHYLPDMQGSAWEDATVQETLDMTTAIGYEEGVTVETPGVIHYLIAAGMIPAPEGYTGEKNVGDFLKTLSKAGEHGQVFRYKSVDTDVIIRVMEKVTGKSYAELLSERIWQPMGAETNGYVLQDGSGAQLAGMGAGSILRDLGRLGEVLRLEGRYNGQQILQPGTVENIRQGGSREALQASPDGSRWTGYSYHDFWWVSHDEDGTFEAKGFSGQHIHVNPAAELVIVKLSSYGTPDPFATHVQDRRAFAAIAGLVRGN
jgi:beta-lactamase